MPGIKGSDGLPGLPGPQGPKGNINKNQIPKIFDYYTGVLSN
jgi:hypothetical protein